jgi:hypothetical protein
MRPETTSALRRANMRTLASLEFRVGLYWWLTRVLPAQPYGWLVVPAFVVGILMLPLLLAGDVVPQLHVPGIAPWVPVVLWFPARVLIVAALAGAMVRGEPSPLATRGQAAPDGAAGRTTRPHLTPLLPLSAAEREVAATVGRLTAMAPLVLLGMALLAGGCLFARPGSVPRPELQEPAIWGLLALVVLALSRAERASAYGQGGCASPFVLYWLFSLAILSQMHMWRLAEWLALIWLLGAAVERARLAGEAAVRSYERLRRRGSSTVLDESAPEPAIRWGLNWRRACTPEAGPRTWLRGTAVLAEQILALSAVSVVALPFVSADLAHMTALACFILLPAFGGVLAVAVSTGGTLGDRSNAFRELLPLPPAPRWSAQALAAITGALVFAAMGEALGAGGLALTRLVTGAPVGAPTAMYWLPLTILAAALIAWAQEPLLRHAVDLVRDGEIILAVLVGVATLVLVPVVLAVALLGTPAWACPVVLWLTAGAVVLLSRATANPRTWDVRLDGYVTHNASQRANAVLLLSATSLALVVACLLAAILAAAVP